MELYAVAKGKRIDETVVGDLHFRCHRGDGIAVGIIFDKSLKDIEHDFFGAGCNCIVGIQALIKILRDADHDLVGLCSLRSCRFLLCSGFSLSGLFRSCGGCSVSALRCSFTAACEKCSHHAYSKDSSKYSLFHKFSFHHCSPFWESMWGIRPFTAVNIVFHTGAFYKKRICFSTILCGYLML